MSTFWHYQAYGLHIASTRELPELNAASHADAPVDVRVEDAAPLGAPEVDSESGRAVTLRGSPDPSQDVYLYWTEIGTLRVTGGNRIRVHAHLDVPPSTLRLPLLGVAFGVLLHQRRLLTLHASAVSIGGIAAAFVGWKGAGKSTIAAALQTRGHALLTDDVLALQPDEWTVRPAFPQIKLREASADAVGAGSLDRLAPAVEKYALRNPDAFCTAAAPLGAIFVLTVADQIGARRLNGRHTLMNVMAQTYAPRFLGSDGTGPEVFAWCNALAQTIPVVELHRPRDLQRLGESAACVETWIERSALTPA